MGDRDWKKNPPKTLEDAFLIAEQLAQGACDAVRAKGLGNPHIERRAHSVVVVWEDGEVTNEIEVERIQ